VRESSCSNRNFAKDVHDFSTKYLAVGQCIILLIFGVPFSVSYRFLHCAWPVLWTAYFTQFSEWPGEICQSWNSEIERHVMIYMLWHEEWSWVKWWWVWLHNCVMVWLPSFWDPECVCQISVDRYIIIHPYLTMQWIRWHCVSLFKHILLTTQWICWHCVPLFKHFSV
jgi:hypothetical protein